MQFWSHLQCVWLDREKKRHTVLFFVCYQPICHMRMSRNPFFVRVALDRGKAKSRSNRVVLARCALQNFQDHSKPSILAIILGVN